MKGKILFIDSVHPILREELEGDGWKCDWFVSKSFEEIQAIIGNYEGIVIRSKFTMNREMFDLSTSLKFIARSGAGLENIDLEYAKAKGVVVFNSPEGNRDAVGEQSLGMLLSLFQKLNKADSEFRNGIWDREGNRGIELKGKTVGVIGYGNMGEAFAKRLRGFECEVLAYDKYKTGFTSENSREVSLDRLQKEADIISFHVPLTVETNYYFDLEFISKCKKPIFLINTARGKVVNTADLVEGLKNGKVRGACLDVLEYESSSFDNKMDKNKPEALRYLLNSDQTILSPHIAGWTKESYVKLSLYLLEKIRAKF